MPSLRARLIAFHLPQFHPIPENDLWWGQGFTEWTNVRKARPLFPGHLQPREPTTLGYYDLHDTSTLPAQAELAQRFGIEGFCFWHYWFEGKLLLEGPLLAMLRSGKPDMPFCVAWANETWSRRWHGKEEDVLLRQTYGGDEDDLAHIAWLLPLLKDPRAIRVDGKPLLLIYRPFDLPEPERTTALWRKQAKNAGLPDLHIVGMETVFYPPVDLRAFGFDATLRFQPQFHNLYHHPRFFRNRVFKKLPFLEPVYSAYKERFRTSPSTYDYAWATKVCRQGDTPSYPRYPCVFPQWDNTPRKARRGMALTDPDPLAYGDWLKSEIDGMQEAPSDHRLVFINAWNEWAEGNYLEPDRHFGDRFLRETLNANTGI